MDEQDVLELVSGKEVFVALLNETTQKNIFTVDNIQLNTPEKVTDNNVNFNTRITVSPDMSSRFYFSKVFLYNRIDFTNHTEIVAKVQNQSMLSELLDQITVSGEFTVLISNLGKTLQAQVTMDDISDTEIPTLRSGQKTGFWLIANPQSLLFTGKTLITLEGA